MSSSSSRSAWDIAWDNAQPRLESISNSINAFAKGNPRVVRVGQLDAELLDQELVALLTEPLTKALTLIKSSLRTKFQPELSFVVQLVLYKLSVWDTGATYGAKLQDLRYQSISSSGLSKSRLTPSGLSRRILLIHASLTVVLPYVHARLRTHALSHSWPEAPSSDPRRKAWEFLTRLESTYAAVGLGSFIAFLWDGRYRTITDRILGLRLVPVRRMVNRNVNYEFMNRQIVWHVFTEFLLFLLPLINTRLLRRRLSRLLTLSPSSYLPPTLQSALGLTPTPSNEKGKSVSQRRGKYFSLPEDQCAICADNASFDIKTTASDTIPSSMSTSTPSGPSKYPITIPYLTSCDHTYCYYCLVDRMLRAADDEERWECLRCEEPVVSCARVEGIIEEATSGSDDLSSLDGFMTRSLDSDDFPSSSSN